MKEILISSTHWKATGVTREDATAGNQCFIQVATRNNRITLTEEVLSLKKRLSYAPQISQIAEPKVQPLMSHEEQHSAKIDNAAEHKKLMNSNNFSQPSEAELSTKFQTKTDTETVDSSDNELAKTPTVNEQ